MSGGNVAVILAVVSGIGLQLSGLEHWVDASNPKFVAGLLLNIAGAVGALFTKQINRDPSMRERWMDAGR
jgi:hypothetical protein